LINKTPLSKLEIYLNPTPSEIQEILPTLSTTLEETDQSRIKIPNSRVEFIERDNYLFVIFYLPEYRKETKTIEIVELDLFFNTKENIVHIFANNTEYFFQKYHEQLKEIKFSSFGKFLQQLLAVVLEDEAKIIDHILGDTTDIRKEYTSSKNTYSVIRYLTNNLINISALNLLVSNQHKLIESVNDYFSKNQLETLNYKRNYIVEELVYAKDFCDTLMNSINTKFQVKSSDDLYVFTKYSFIIFLAELVISFIGFFLDNRVENLKYFGVGSFLIFLASLVVLFIFRRKN
jgi:hypothetical protein